MKPATLLAMTNAMERFSQELIAAMIINDEPITALTTLHIIDELQVDEEVFGAALELLWIGLGMKHFCFYQKPSTAEFVEVNVFSVERNIPQKIMSLMISKSASPYEMVIQELMLHEYLEDSNFKTALELKLARIATITML